MPKNTKKRTRVKDLAQPEQELTTKAAKKVKGGLLPAVRPLLPAVQSSLNTTAQKVKTSETSKGGFTLGDISGGELQ